jgi:hypothetical protein
MQCMKIKFGAIRQDILTVGPFPIFCVCVFMVSLIFTLTIECVRVNWVFGLVHHPVF